MQKGKSACDFFHVELGGRVEWVFFGQAVVVVFIVACTQNGNLKLRIRGKLLTNLMTDVGVLERLINAVELASNSFSLTSC